MKYYCNTIILSCAIVNECVIAIFAAKLFRRQIIKLAHVLCVIYVDPMFLN